MSSFEERKAKYTENKLICTTEIKIWGGVVWGGRHAGGMCAFWDVASGGRGGMHEYCGWTA